MHDLNLGAFRPKKRLLQPNLRRLKSALNLLETFSTLLGVKPVLLKLFFGLLGGALALLSRKSAFASLHGAHPKSSPS